MHSPNTLQFIAQLERAHYDEWLSLRLLLLQLNDFRVPMHTVVNRKEYCDAMQWFRSRLLQRLQLCKCYITVTTNICHNVYILLRALLIVMNDDNNNNAYNCR